MLAYFSALFNKITINNILFDLHFYEKIKEDNLLYNIVKSLSI